VVQAVRSVLATIENYKLVGIPLRFFLDEREVVPVGREAHPVGAVALARAVYAPCRHASLGG